MNSFFNNDSRGKQYLFTLVQVALFFLIMNLVFKYTSDALNAELLNPDKFDKGLNILYKIYISGTAITIATGVLYCLLSRTKRPGGNRTKAASGRWELLIWIVPCVFFAGWHVMSILPPSFLAFDVPYPPQNRTGVNFWMPSFQAILLLLLGYTIAARSFQRDVWRWHILRAAIFFTVSFIATMGFQSICSTVEFGGFLHNGPRYTQLGYFFIFVIYCGIGALFGLMHYLSYESKNPGTWRIEWLRLIAWCAVAFYFLWQHDLLHPGVSGISIKWYSLILMFIFGNTITTSFDKKAADEGEHPAGT